LTFNAFQEKPLQIKHCWHFSQGEFLVFIEYYDLLDVCELQNFHAGIEIYLLDLTLQIGYDRDVLRYGLGIKNKKCTFDAYWENNSSLQDILYFGISLP
jgi:hypothetical protein